MPNTSALSNIMLRFIDILNGYLKSIHFDSGSQYALVVEFMEKM